MIHHFTYQNGRLPEPASLPRQLARLALRMKFLNKHFSTRARAIERSLRRAHIMRLRAHICQLASARRSASTGDARSKARAIGAIEKSRSCLMR